MLNILCDLAVRVVFTGVNGTILIVPLLILIYVLIGQARQFEKEVEKIFK